MLNYYSISNLKIAAEKPYYFHSELKRILKFRNECDIFEEDWDNLILLDACRYDAFSQINSIDGDLESRVSKGSSSREFISKNFRNRELHNTVYISANPYIGEIKEGSMHAVVSLLNDWDESLQTVHPSTVVRRSEELLNQFDDKRIIIHFMQPHEPYIGNKAKEIKSKLDKYGGLKGYDNTIRKKGNDKKNLSGVSALNAANDPHIPISKSDIWEAYKETLEITLEHVRNLVDILNGRSVISSDHGELIGDSPLFFLENEYGHPSGVYVEELRKVPWFIIPSEDRRSIIDDPPVQHDSVNELDKKLRALGYK